MKEFENCECVYINTGNNSVCVCVCVYVCLFVFVSSGREHTWSVLQAYRPVSGVCVCVCV